MSSMTAKNFAAADETRTPDKTRVETVDLGAGIKAARISMEPGWAWSECIKPIAGTQTCRARHVGTVVSGQMHLAHEDGTQADLRAGDAYVIEPGHDAWVTGSEPFVGIEFETITAGTYAKTRG
jgi:mannose-6-phosphate isomerase-like protein (cupin superfamily)